MDRFEIIKKNLDCKGTETFEEMNTMMTLVEWEIVSKFALWLR